MRHDMAKVLIEAPRRNSGDRASTLKGAARRRYKLTGKLNRGWHGGGTKEPSDNFPPLVAFLDKQVGRPWNDVYSEICEWADPRTIHGWHLRSHVLQMVSTDLYRARSYFVNENGILCEAYRERYRYRLPDKPSQPKWVHLDQDTQLTQWADGLWYFMKVGPLTSHSTQVYDPITELYIWKNVITASQKWEATHSLGREVECFTRSLCSRKLMRKHNLHNEPKVPS